MRNMEEYMHALDEIARINFIDEHLEQLARVVSLSPNANEEDADGSDDDLD